MNAIVKVATQAVVQGTCKGIINGTNTFEAGMVELSEASYPPPHGQAYVMLATERAPAPSFTTKELKVSFSKGSPDGEYGLFPDLYTVRVLFIDRSAPQTPVVYTQYQGIARVKYDSASSTFSGEISATLENLDEDTRKIVDVRVNFEAHPYVPVRRNPRRPSSPAAHC
ncbi:hypothetical protein [Pseudomonas sp. B21-053]|uniref:hypothetical protein n=1 Tax=Pseudomonas sp. B21-053 TaxID=2895493 RepID=UPI00222F9C36|nr:hypothetical protein [Pseudomonas sp. B21-053]UZE09243.1 hypothetical protein LOY68_17105 [Pseudomonas sp. B21-053]